MKKVSSKGSAFLEGVIILFFLSSFLVVALSVAYEWEKQYLAEIQQLRKTLESINEGKLFHSSRSISLPRRKGGG